jgi:hypothetical protein
MKHSAATRRQQSGIALLMLLAVLILAGGYALYRSANIGQSHTAQTAKLAMTLARAKDALIARAVTDANRPGSLPCPDLITDNAGFNNHPDDGLADMFIGAATAECPSYVGRLPWVTIDLPEPTDNSATRLWYALSPTLRDDNSASPINSDTTAALSVDGGGEIAAVIIAPGGALPGQTRPSNTPSDYLEGENANSDNSYVSGPANAIFNDVIAIITRQELMAAVEKRVANEVKVCLEQHTLATANSLHNYPWPAPFSSLAFRGKSGSYFGQLPATQPSAGLNASLLENIAQVQSARNALGSATQASDQLAAVQQLTEALSQARNLYDVLYMVATRLWQNASITAKASTTLTTELSKFLKSNTIVNSEQKTIRAEAQTVIDQIDGLYNTLDDSGFDIFPSQLQIRRDQYQAQKNVASAQAIQLLLANSTTTHADIGPALADARDASIVAVIAANDLSADPNDPARMLAAATAATTLDTNLSILQATISNSRINRHFSEIAPYPAQINTLNNLVNSAPNAGNTNTLATKLTETKVVLLSIQTGASAILASRNTSLLAIDQALSAAHASIDYPLINSTASNVVSSIDSLVDTMIINDDNLTRTSLAAAITDFKAQQAIFAALNIAATGDRIPYAISLQNVTVDLKYWANLVVAEADNLARQAKGVPIAIGENFAKVTPLNTSNYQSAVSALASSQNAASAAQTYINTPTVAKQAAASTALADTLSTAGKLLSAANTLDASLDSSTSGALPIIWLSSRCDAFRETADSWWINNQWKNLVFYQISEAMRTAAPGRLQVNQAGSYRVVVVTAGSPLPLPCPPSAQTIDLQSHASRSISNYLEEINADTSRDGNADSPRISLNFISKPPSTCFNDRLAY